MINETCAGLRYLISTIVPSSLFAHFALRSRRRRTVFMVLAVAVPILANGLRGIVVVMVDYHLGGGSAIAADHALYGWALHGAVFAMLLAIGSALREPIAARTTMAEPAGVPSPGGRNSSRPVVATGLALSTLFAAAGLPLLPANGPADSTVPGLAVAAPPSWAEQPAGTPALHAGFPGTQAIHEATYAKGGDRINLVLAVYARQTQGAEIVNTGNGIADPAVWLTLDRSWRRVKIGETPTLLQATRIRSSAGDRLVWQLYWVGGRTIGDPVSAKLLQVWTMLTGGDPTAATLLIAAPSGGDPAAAESTIRRFLDDLGPPDRFLARSIFRVPAHRDQTISTSGVKPRRASSAAISSR